MTKSISYNPVSYPIHCIENSHVLDLLIDEHGDINHGVNISGKQIQSLSKVKRIKGSLIIVDSTIESLGSLEEVWGELRVSSYVLDSNLKSLGNLKLVKGDVSLQHTKIKNLGFLKIVDGALRLPKSLKGILDTSGTKVANSLRYLRGKEVQLGNSLWLRTIQKEEPVPFWQSRYNGSTEAITEANSIQKGFYLSFKENFLNGVFYDIEGNTNYLYILYFDFIENQIPNLEFHLKNLRDYYFQHIGRFIDGDKLEKDLSKLKTSGNYEKALELELKKGHGFSVHDVFNYTKKIGLVHLSPKMLIDILWATTEKFSELKVEKLKPLIEIQIKEYEQKKGYSFFSQFFDENLNIIAKGNKIDLEYYSNFFPDSFHFYSTLDTTNGSNFHLIERAHLSHVFEKAIWFELKKILSKAIEEYEKIEDPQSYKRKREKEKRRIENQKFRESKIYDCKEQRIVTLDELKVITGKNISISIFKTKKSLYKRFILFDNKEDNRVFKQWKTIIDEATDKEYRFNLESFAEFVGVDSRSVWGFFNGRQKKFFKRYKIKQT